MSAPAAVEVNADTVRNVIHMRFHGVVTVAHVQAALVNFETLLGKMRVGFAAVTDLSGLDVMDLECAPHLAQMMDRFREQRVGKVVRLIPDPHKDIGFNILAATHYRGLVQVITCVTAAELERALA